MKNLSIDEATSLYKWANENHKENWGVWMNYPISGCSFLQFEDNPLDVKFDEMTSFGTLKFKRIGWGRRISGKEASITFRALSYELEQAGVKL